MLIFSLKYGNFPDKPNLKLLRHAVANTYDEIPPPDIQRLLPVHARLLRHRFVNQQWSCRASAAFASKCVSAFTLYSVRNFVLNWHIKYLYLRQWSIINKTTKYSVMQRVLTSWRTIWQYLPKAVQLSIQYNPTILLVEA